MGLVCWRIVAVLSEIIWTTLNTVLYCRVQIEHQQFFIIPWCHWDGTTIYCLSVNDKGQSSVQCCCASLCTQPSQSAGNLFSHWDAQGWFLYIHVYVYCTLQCCCVYLNLDFSQASDFIVSQENTIHNTKSFFLCVAMYITYVWGVFLHECIVLWVVNTTLMSFPVEYICYCTYSVFHIYMYSQ